MSSSVIRSLPALLVALTGAACDKKPDVALAPSASALAPAEKLSASARPFEVEQSGSKVSFVMDAPIEKIYGEALNSAEGQLFIDPSDLTKSSGLVKVDLFKLELFQQKREDESSEFGERKKNDRQNQHARTWLEISEDAPAEEREKNRWVELKIDKVLTASAKDLSQLKGAERSVNLQVEGDLRLHQRSSRKKVDVNVVFHYEGEQLRSLRVKTLEPLNVGLGEHDVRPRELFGKLAQKTLEDMGQKVAKEAPIQIELTAKAK